MSKRKPFKRKRRPHSDAGHGERRAREEHAEGPTARGERKARSFIRLGQGGGPHKSSHSDSGKRFGSQRSGHDGSFRSNKPQASGPRTAEQQRSVVTTTEKLESWLAASDELRTRPRPPMVDAEGVPILDAWQREAVDALLGGNSVIVDAPTTAGKTRVVEAFFHMRIQDPTFRAAYTTPVKSLSNDKLREFREMFGKDQVGIATGDIKENLHAPIVVATLESYRNSLLGTEPDLGRTLVVFDEYHYLQDEGRGSAWEEAMILTPSDCQILMLSASVANPGDFRAWLESLGDSRRCELIGIEERPVPLEPLVWHQGAWLLPETIPPNALKRLDEERLERPLPHEELIDRLVPLVGMGLTPTIVYAGRRLACETLAAALSKRLSPLPEAESEAIGAALERAHAEVGALSFFPPRLRHMLQVYGVGYHHSGLAAPARIAIESLVKAGLLRFTAATMGLSLGINFAVRSAVISDYQRPGELGFTEYAPSEVLQMLGRAGRRGRDVVGFSLWPTPEAYSRFGRVKREDCASRLRNDPTTFLGLVGRGYSLRGIENFYSKSFRRFTDPRADFSLITKSRLVKLLERRQITSGAKRQKGAKPAAADDRLTSPAKAALALPCTSPAAESGRHAAHDLAALCHQCPYREPCHETLAHMRKGELASMHVHLHRIDALARDESLTDFGRIARYFPQAGGMVFARMLVDGRLTPEKLAAACELAGAFSLACFKEPAVAPHYRFPFNVREIDAEMEAMYPFSLFPELYDKPFGRRAFPVIRDLNPAGGFVVSAWIAGASWRELMQTVGTEQYGAGDVMNLLFRVATFLQSIMQAEITGFVELARRLRLHILREPLSFALEIGKR